MDYFYNYRCNDVSDWSWFLSGWTSSALDNGPRPPFLLVSCNMGRRLSISNLRNSLLSQTCQSAPLHSHASNKTTLRGINTAQRAQHTENATCTSPRDTSDRLWRQKVSTLHPWAVPSARCRSPFVTCSLIKPLSVDSYPWPPCL